MKRQIHKVITFSKMLLLAFGLLFQSCTKDSYPTIGPFKPISNIDDIIILGNNSQFVAFNVRTKLVEETYKLPESYADNFGYTAGHLLLTTATAPNSNKEAGCYNIDVKSGRVFNHTMQGIYYLTCSNDQLLEASSTEGYATYRYNVVANKMDGVFKHSIECKYYSYSIERNDTIYWFTDNFFHNSNNKYFLNSFNETVINGNNDELQDFNYVKNELITRRARQELDRYDNATITLEKIESLTPLKSKYIFTYPKDHLGGISETLLYKDKIILFTASELYMIDQSGKILFRWGDYENERDYSVDYKSFYGRMSKKIIDDKLFVFGQRYNSKENTQINCCVEIDLISGKDNWIEVWKGFE
jgi:hypothetical protein